MDVYTEKTKDQTVHKILTFYSKLGQTQIMIIYWGMIMLPIILTFIASFFISNSPILIIFAIMLFSLSAIVYALFLLIEILNKDTGSERMLEIADAIREGSEGFFQTQYSTIFKLSIVFGIAIFSFYFGRTITPDEVIKNIIGPYTIAFLVVFSFFMGALCSALSGYTGMWVSVRANIRYMYLIQGCCSCNEML
jgi:MFS family permease